MIASLLYRKNLLAVFFGLLLLVVGGCSSQSGPEEPTVLKPPKPVSTLVLSQSRPEINGFTTGTVAPWKTEEIGFEQVGRVAYVIEPNEMVRPIVGDGGQSRGTPIARLDDEKMRIAVKSAKADVSIAKLKRDANRISIEERLPAAISAAAAELQLATTELQRTERLGLQNAVSKSELDIAKTQKATTQSQLAAAEAELLQAKAEQLAFEAEVVRVEHALAEAERNLQNTVLYSSFPGIVSTVHAVPGSYVIEGDPVVTVQMADPMLVEFEVTARKSRRYQVGDSLKVFITDAQGNTRPVIGMVYAVDATADAQSRTFTVTLHVRNELQIPVLPKEAAEHPIARTRRIYPLNIGPIVTGDDRLLIERSAIHSIDGKTYVWIITNKKWNTLSVDGNRLLTVKRIPVRIISDVIPFLGKWNFVTTEFLDPKSVDIEQDLITDELYFPQDAESVSTDVNQHDAGKKSTAMTTSSWKGNQLILERKRWLLRAGDIVRVALMPEKSPGGYYIPMKAVREEKGHVFVHVIDTSSKEATAKRVEVKVAISDSVAKESLLLHISAVNEGELTDGMNIVVGGTHFLNDGDRVRMTPVTGASR